jgi:UDP-GlcNAc:undecaprenyl-phosphate GlcNAc-1-phosphate transferase
MIAYLLPAGLAFALSYVLTWAVRALAPRLGLVDRPREAAGTGRRCQRLGGVAIYLGFVAPLLLFARPGSAGASLALLAGGAFVFAVGLLDDVRPLENRPKLTLLILSALLPVLLGVRFEMLSPIFGVPLAAFWILGATNAFNWLDNMDGVAAGVAAIASASLVVLSLRGADHVVLPALLLGAAALGFLAHNFPPARVFMGDCGSGFLGFTLATLAVLGSHRNVGSVLLTVLVPGLILAVPIFDSATVTVLRLLHGRSLFQGGRDHPAHRLVTLGLPERKVVVLLYVLSATAGGAGLAATGLNILVGLTMTVVLAVGFAALGLVLAEVRVYEGGASGDGEGLGARLPLNGQTVLPAPFLHKKWIAVMLADLLLVPTAFVAAHLLRFEGELPPAVAAAVAHALPVVVGVKVAALALAGVYRGAWRYAGALDLLRLVEGATVGSVAVVVVLYVWTGLQGLSRAALVVDWLLTVLLLGASRFSLRVLREYLIAQTARGRPVLIFGAGSGGVLVLQELRHNPALGCRPVGFIDDDPAKRGAVVQGLPVLGSRRDLRELVRRYGVEEVLVAAPSCPPEVVAEVVVACREAGARARIAGLVLA